MEEVIEEQKPDLPDTTVFRPCLLCGGVKPNSEQLILCIRDYCVAIGFCGEDHLKEVFDALGSMIQQMPKFKAAYEKWCAEGKPDEQGDFVGEFDKGPGAKVLAKRDGYL